MLEIALPRMYQSCQGTGSVSAATFPPKTWEVLCIKWPVKTLYMQMKCLSKFVLSSHCLSWVSTSCISFEIAVSCSTFGKKNKPPLKLYLGNILWLGTLTARLLKIDLWQSKMYYFSGCNFLILVSQFLSELLAVSHVCIHVFFCVVGMVEAKILTDQVLEHNIIFHY